MPKIMNQLVISSTSESTISTGAVGGGGGISYDVSVFAQGQSTTSSYNNLSYSDVSAVQHGTFDNGTVNTSGAPYGATATGVSRFTFDTAGIYVVEFVSYGQAAGGGFQFIDFVRNGVREQVLCYVGIYANYNRKYATSIRQFEVGDELTFYTADSVNAGNLSRILIAKIG